MALICLCYTAEAVESRPEITLPEIMAVELPAGVGQIGPAESPLRELLSAARSGTRSVTSDLQRKIGAGPVRVTWTAWDGPPNLGKPVATRTARIIILPAGMTPVGVSGSENATAGNNAVHIARDSGGHVHMIWKDDARGPVYRRAIVDSRGSVRFETEPVYLVDDTPADWNSFPALAVAGDTVQFVWQGGGTARTRRLTPGPSGWTFATPAPRVEAAMSGLLLRSMARAVCISLRRTQFMHRRAMVDKPGRLKPYLCQRDSTSKPSPSLQIPLARCISHSVRLWHVQIHRPASWAGTGSCEPSPDRRMAPG
jgi:hypothetical protein